MGTVTQKSSFHLSVQGRITILMLPVGFFNLHFCVLMTHKRHHTARAQNFTSPEMETSARYQDFSQTLKAQTKRLAFWETLAASNINTDNLPRTPIMETPLRQLQENGARSGGGTPGNFKKRWMSL